MHWFVYSISPIDFKWERLRSVRETIAHMAAVIDDNSNPNDVSDIQEFIRVWDSAKDAASENGWDGDYRNPPAVFWLPDDSEFSYGFVIKHDNNGETFIVSPRELPWAQNL
jgi:hypothetical protein